MTQRRFSVEEEREIVREYMAGSSSTQLAARYDCDLTTVLSAVRRAGLKPRSISAARTGRGIRQFSTEQERDVLVRWAQGESQTSIGRVYGAHQVTIGRLLRRLGVEPKPRRARRETHGGWKGGRAKSGEGYILAMSD